MKEETTGLAMDRRSFVKGGAALLASTALFGFAGCAPQGGGASGGSTFTPGTYSAEGLGKNGPIFVECELSEEGLVSVTVTKHDETKYVADTAIERIPAQAVEYQTLDIDAVSGATLTSMAILSAAADCVNQAGGKASGLANEEIVKSTETVEMTTDIIVIGAGAAGGAAAIAAGQEGKSVVLLEQTSNIGGNSIVSGGYLEYVNAPDSLKMDMNEGYAAAAEEILSIEATTPEAQAILDEARADWEAYKASGDTKVFDSLAFYAVHNHTFRGGTIENYYIQGANRMEAADWLVDLGLKALPLTPLVGSLWPRWTRPTSGNGGEGYAELFSSVITSGEYDIELMMETEGKELLTDGSGAVTGVRAQSSETGITYDITANNGVIIATGGYAGNAELIKKYDEFWNFDADQAIPNTNAAAHVGSGLVMAETVGAQIDGEKRPMMFPFADAKNSSPGTTVGETGNALLVNREGKRFVNETKDRWTLSGAIMEQTDELGIIISDAENSGVKDGMIPFGIREDLVIENGQLFKADTLEELAEAAGIDPDNLVKTVELYNEYAANFEDPDFERTAFNETSFVKTPPFYASPRTWAAHLVYGGIAIADNMKDWSVVDTNGQPIPGLYASGEARHIVAGIGVMGDGMACARFVAQQ